MTHERAFRAAIFDVDGVLTRTAALHQRAWKRMFDAFLEGRGGQAPFSAEDYRAHVDGKPRFDGVRDFLASRGVELAEGTDADDGRADTVRGLGRRKNEDFLRLLDREGVETFDDAVAALLRWRRSGMAVAAVSASRNCRRVLDAADLLERFDAVVDGRVAEDEGLRGKPGLLTCAARRLGVAPEDAVVFEDAVAGVRAAREGGFGLVVGVARSEGAERDLEAAGAHEVVGDVFRVRLCREVPSVLERLDELEARRAGRPLAVFLDFDGTLAPIVEHPSDAGMSEAARALVSELRCPVAIISGRDRADVEARVAIEGIWYAGNHGLDIAGRGQRRTLPEAEDAVSAVDDAEAELERRFGGESGVVIERKRYSVAAHYRQVKDQALIERLTAAVQEVRARTGLRLRKGKKVWELEPALDWDKGKALRWLVDTLPDDPAGPWFVVYCGDDETDEDAFAVLRGVGVGVRVAEEPVTDTLADYRLGDPDAVVELLGHLRRWCDASERPA